MGILMLEYVHGTEYFECRKCQTRFASKNDISSKNFKSSTGPAYLFKKVVNTFYGEIHLKVMATGQHHIRNAYCKRCNQCIGWTYENAFEESELYKIGQTILECAYVKFCSNVFDDTIN